MSWTTRSMQWIDQQVRSNPDMTPTELRKWLSKNYPYAKRKGWAYTAWLKAVKLHFNPQVRRLPIQSPTNTSAQELEALGQQRLEL